MNQKSSTAVSIFAVATTGLMILTLWLVVAFPYTSHTEAGKVLTITTNPNAANLQFIGLAIWVGGIVASILCLIRKSWFGFLPFAMVMASPIVIFFAAFEHVDEFRDASMIQDEAGNEYHLLMSHFLQGSTLYIAKVTERHGNQTSYQILANSPWEESFGYLGVIRPSSAPESPSLYLTFDHILVGIPSSNRAYFGYDLEKNEMYSFADERNAKDIRSLSPFLLLGKDDTPSEEDFMILKTTTEFGEPNLDVIRLDLQNQNPKVREMAQALLNPKK
jgi:hypothetical protein